MPTLTNPCLTHWVPGLSGSHLFAPVAGSPKSFGLNWSALAGPEAWVGAVAFARVDPVVVDPRVWVEPPVGGDVVLDPPHPQASAAEQSAIKARVATTIRPLAVFITLGSFAA